MSRSLAAAACVLALSGCGGARTLPTNVDHGAIDPRLLFPFVDGTVYSYTVRDGTNLPTLATLRVLTVVGDRVTIQRNRQPADTLIVSAEGIRMADEPAWLLRAPITVGASFPAEGGRTARVGSVDEVVRTGLGEHHGCVRIDEIDAESGVHVETTYCPDVGPVRIVSSLVSELTGMRLDVRAELIGRVQVDSTDTPP